MLTFDLVTEQQTHHLYLKFCDLQTQIETLKGEILILEDQGTLDGHAWYKDGKYLYLVHHLDQHKQYIGADPEKQREALALLDRYAKVKHLSSNLATLEMARSASLRLFHTLEDILRTPESYHSTSFYR
ncbi:MAG: hypothetical protein HUU38_03150 [Anaerolineales bacterium]|nr:hypothetical protein [Anaerolineales bacterium]